MRAIGLFFLFTSMAAGPALSGSLGLEGSPVASESIAPAGVSFAAFETDPENVLAPPNPELAVGPSHVVAAVNVEFAVFDKAGALVDGPTSLDAFFAGTAGYPGTPHSPEVLYDESADRFFLGVGVVAGSHYCFGVTTGPDPTGSWNRYCFPAFGEYYAVEGVGVGEEGFFVGVSVFDSEDPGGRVVAIPKADAYAGVPLGPVPSRSTTSPWFSPLPVHLQGFSRGTWPVGSDRHWFVASHNGVFSTNERERYLSVWTWTDPFGEDVFALEHSVFVDGPPLEPPTSFPDGSGWSDRIGVWRETGEVGYEDGRLFTTRPVRCLPEGSDSAVNCIRTTEIDLASGAVVGGGLLAAANEYREVPALGVDRCGDVAVGFTDASLGTFPGVSVAGHRAVDPPGLFGEALRVKAGEAGYRGDRWSEQTGMALDPDGTTFWYHGQYSSDRPEVTWNWGTWIASAEYEGCLAELFRDGFEKGTVCGWSSDPSPVEAFELCDSIDNDCDNLIDDGCVYCQPDDPAPVCGEGNRCLPRENGDVSCQSGGGGTGTQGDLCEGPGSCFPGFECVFDGSTNLCAQWCSVGSFTCPGFATCVSFDPALYVGEQEWGACIEF